MLAGDLVAVAAMLSLRRSFSILVEARQLVTTGLYRFARHPLYAGEILVAIGWGVAFPAAWDLAGTALFIVLQVVRARMEEAKLTRVFPDYALYRKATGLFWPGY